MVPVKKQYKPKDENVKKLMIFLNKIKDGNQEIKRINGCRRISRG